MLTEWQTAVLVFLEREATVLTHLEMDGLDVTPRLAVAAGYAFALYGDLIASGRQVAFDQNRLLARKVHPADPEFFRDGRDSAETDEIVLKLISPLRPGLIQSGADGGFIYLVMPIRLNV